MKITILDDYHDTVRTLGCFRMLAGHDVTIWNDHVQDNDALAQRLERTEALVLIRERTQIRAPLIARLDNFRLISQRSVYPHIDSRRAPSAGILVCSNQHPGTPSYATAELTFALILAAMRQIPQQVASLTPVTGRWASADRAWQDHGHLRLGQDRRRVADYAKAFGMNVVVWAREASRERAAQRLDVAGGKPAFFSDCDIVSLHMRLVPATRGIVTAADLAL